MKGELYKITNVVNGKIYIGKTYIGYMNRWKQHKSDAFRDDRKVDYKFYRAIRNYGVDKFEVSLLGQYESGELEEMEIKTIKEYNSFYGGYNSTLGGEGRFQREYDEEKIVDMYKSGISITAICEEFGYKSNRIVSSIIKRNVGQIDTRTKAVVLEQYDKKWNLLRKFSSKGKAYEWLVENYKDNMKKCTAYYYIKRASETKGIAFGYHWLEVEETEVHITDKDRKACTNRYIVSAYLDGKIVLDRVTMKEAYEFVVNHVDTVTRKESTIRDAIIRSNGNPKYGFIWKVEKL